MTLDIDTNSAVPPYDQIRAQMTTLQIRAQMTTLVTSGVLAPGDRLPAIRQLAGDLGLAPGTVARAYRELELAGLVATHGTRVAEHPGVAPRPHASHLEEAAATFAAAASRSGSNLDQAIAALRRAFERITTAPLDAEGST